MNFDILAVVLFLYSYCGHFLSPFSLQSGKISPIIQSFGALSLFITLLNSSQMVGVSTRALFYVFITNLIKL